MSATGSDFFLKSGRFGLEWVADMLRIWWPPWFGINGRLAPDYAPCFACIGIHMQLPKFLASEAWQPVTNQTSPSIPLHKPVRGKTSAVCERDEGLAGTPAAPHYLAIPPLTTQYRRSLSFHRESFHRLHDKTIHALFLPFCNANYLLV